MTNLQETNRYSRQRDEPMDEHSQLRHLTAIVIKQLLSLTIFAQVSATSCDGHHCDMCQ